MAAQAGKQGTYIPALCEGVTTRRFARTPYMGRECGARKASADLGHPIVSTRRNQPTSDSDTGPLTPAASCSRPSSEPAINNQPHASNNNSFHHQHRSLAVAASRPFPICYNQSTNLSFLSPDEQIVHHEECFNRRGPCGLRPGRSSQDEAREDPSRRPAGTS